MEQNSLCLISPPSRAHSTRPPLGLMTILAYLEKNGIRTELIDIKVDDLKVVELGSPRAQEIENQIFDKVKQLKPRMIGLSAYTHEVSYIIDFAKRLKEVWPTTIIVGGQHASLAPQDFIFEDSPVAFAVIGEGEETFRELCQTILENKPSSTYDHIQSLAFWDGTVMKKTPLRPLIEPLDEVPMPAYDRVDMEFYTRPHPYAIRYLPLSSMFVFASRGCPARCTFCAIPSVWRYNETKKPIRFRSPKAVVDEVEHLVKKYKVDAIYFYDDDFCVWKEHVIKICQEFISRGLPFVWGCETRVDKVDDELMGWMAKAGCIQIDFGVESGSQKMLDAVNKNCKVADIHTAFDLCKKYGIRTFANMMYNLPGETEEDVKANQALIQTIRPTTVSFGLMTPYPGSVIYDELSDGPEDYHYFKDAEWVLPKKFQVAKHEMDLNKLVSEDNIRYNSPLRQFGNTPAMVKVLAQVIRSRRKTDYAMAVVRLGKFFLFDRIPRMVAKNVSPYGILAKKEVISPASPTESPAS
ncbi:MAG: radical SAM protein [Candidatus Diapherotrites archaeon]|nr:radical SAM protein [Candidatus Diapherotrites archaeon]MDZ4256542.1 radical SAM protein [archaeon]